MKKFFIAATALSGLLAFAGSASAADPVVDLPYDWSGFYLGVQGGLGIADSSGDPGSFVAVEGHYSYTIEDFLIGGYSGFNIQSGSLVYGLEGDLSYSALDERGTTVPLVATVRDVTTDIDWLGAVRGRLGYAMGNTLLYAAGGVAFGDVELSHSFPAGGATFHTYSKTRVGWTIGGGVEHAFSESLTGRLDYRYVDLGHDSDQGGVNSTLDNDLEIHEIQAGIGWNF